MFSRDRGRNRGRWSMFGPDSDADCGPEMWRDWFGMGSPGSHGRGSPVRRGDVRDAILVVLAREPMHGYRIIGELADISGGRWRPSAGSVYPTLQSLEDEGLVTSEESEGRRVFSLTQEGQAAATRASARGGPQWTSAPSGAGSGDSSRSSAGSNEGDAATPAADTATGSTSSPPAEVRDALYQLSAAAAQAAQVGSPETVAGVKTVLTDARKAIYRLLAEEDEPGTR